MWKWTFKSQVESRAAPITIWKLWTNVADWPKWDHGLEYCILEGPFTAGAKGRLKPKNGPRLSFTLTKVHQNMAFSDVTKLPLTVLEFSHELKILENGKTLITHEATAKGLLAPILFLTLRKELKTEMPKAMKKLSEMAENL